MYVTLLHTAHCWMGKSARSYDFFQLKIKVLKIQKSLVPIASSFCKAYAKGYYALFGAIAIAFDKDTNLVIFTPN